MSWDTAYRSDDRRRALVFALEQRRLGDHQVGLRLVEGPARRRHGRVAPRDDLLEPLNSSSDVTRQLRSRSALPELSPWTMPRSAVPHARARLGSVGVVLSPSSAATLGRPRARTGPRPGTSRASRRRSSAGQRQLLGEAPRKTQSSTTSCRSDLLRRICPQEVVDRDGR